MNGAVVWLTGLSGAGQIARFTGVSDPDEPPESPAVEVRTDRETQAESAQKIVDALVARGLA